MAYDTEKHHRRSLRLRGYDYARPGAYFVTICTYQRECLLGEIRDGQMILNAYGRIVHEEWYKTATVRPYVALDAFVVMPNHLHGIVIITERRGTAPPCPYQTARMDRPPVLYKGEFGKPIAGTLPTIIRSFKSVVTQRINEMRGTAGLPLEELPRVEGVGEAPSADAGDLSGHDQVSQEELYSLAARSARPVLLFLPISRKVAGEEEVLIAEC